MQRQIRTHSGGGGHKWVRSSVLNTTAWVSAPHFEERAREREREHMKDIEWMGKVEEREIERVQWVRARQRAQTVRVIIERGDREMREEIGRVQ